LFLLRIEKTGAVAPALRLPIAMCAVHAPTGETPDECPKEDAEHCGKQDKPMRWVIWRLKDEIKSFDEGD